MEEVGPDQVEGLKEYITALEGTRVVLDSGETVEILKSDIRERKGKATLIFRYQLQP